MEEVILVDTRDRKVGTMDKLQAHREGRLHRAVSVCLFNAEGQWLLQRRAAEKYHSPGLWSNSCCSHPFPGERAQRAAQRRMVEELGMACPLSFFQSIIYRADVGNGLVEHEFDHLFIGQYDGPVVPNPREVADVQWWDTNSIVEALQKTPFLFTRWFPILVEAIVGTPREKSQ